jgi:hypothetical protein
MQLKDTYKESMSARLLTIDTKHSYSSLPILCFSSLYIAFYFFMVNSTGGAIPYDAVQCSAMQCGFISLSVTVADGLQYVELRVCACGYMYVYVICVRLQREGEGEEQADGNSD